MTLEPEGAQAPPTEGQEDARGLTHPREHSQDGDPRHWTIGAGALPGAPGPDV